MPDLTVADRLQPALLDRLVDEHPEEKVESRERRVMNMAQLRRAILRDLQWLLNAQARPSSDDVYGYPNIASSVLNFGLPDSAGQSITGRRRAEVRAAVERAIQQFEPRLLPKQLRVTEVDSESGRNKLIFEIAGEIAPLPMPESLFVRTEVDTELGQWRVGDDGRA
ncbi:type VI secretion system baseplate subunit TssE [soil metagenome]